MEVKTSCCSSDSNTLEKPNQAKSSCCSSDSITFEKTDKAKSSCCSSKVEEQSKDIPLSPATSEEKVVYRVHGMDCPACAVTIEKGLGALKGIRDVKVNYSTAKLQMVGDVGSFDQIENQVQKLGYAVESLEQNKNMRTYNIEGMDCGSCAKSIENHLNTLPSVRNVSVNFSTGKMKIDHDNSVEDIVSEVAKIGYKAFLLTKSGKTTETPKNKEGNGLIIFSGALIALGFIGSYNGISPIMSNILYAIVIVLTGYKPVKSAYYALKSRSLDMNVLMSAAAIGAALIGEWLEGATVVWLFALGIVLQNRSIEKTRNSIRNLMDLAPPEAWVLNGTELGKKPVEEISVGQIIIFKCTALIKS
ncbi:heavy metal translocating P-type ATPase [Cytobacillus citreus]|uniref:heavy metal translocating P-type ATPase n=1 Tax=Cytobacillus citreus TaxID=2833586 RepID=UPI003083F91D